MARLYLRPVPIGCFGSAEVSRAGDPWTSFASKIGASATSLTRLGRLAKTEGRGVGTPSLSRKKSGKDMKRQEIEGISHGNTTRLQRDVDGNDNGDSREVYTP
jgi:hypothetical protein